MAKNGKKAYAVKNKKGVTYFLHIIKTPRYYFAKRCGKNAVGAKPEGYKVLKGRNFPILARV